MERARATALQMPWALKFAGNYAQMDRSQTRFAGKEVSNSIKLFSFGSIINETKKKECDLLGCNYSEGCHK